MAQIHDRLVNLLGLANGILTQLSNFKDFWNDNQRRPSFLNEPACQKINKTLAGKFPEIPAPDKGFDFLKPHATEFVRLCSPYFYAFVDAAEFRKVAYDILIDVSNGMTEFHYDLNSYVMENFLDVYVRYIQLILYVKSLDEKAQFLPIFLVCSSLTGVGVDIIQDSYKNFPQYLSNYSRPFKVLPNELKPIGSKIVQCLVSFHLDYIKIRSPEVLRKDGTLSITLHSEKFTRPIHTKFLNEMMMASKIYTWFFFGLLCSPEDLGIDGALETVKTALSEGFMIPLFRDKTARLLVHYEELFSSFKTKTLKLSKHKGIVKDGIAKAVDSGNTHKARRTLLRQELHTLYYLLKDSPVLIAPKLQLLFAALAYAKEEIFWFFRHLNQPAKSKYYKPEDFHDNHITELFYLLSNFLDLIRQHRRLISTYYLEYLSGADQKKLEQLCSGSFANTVGPEAAVALQNLLDSISEIDVQNDHDLNWKEPRMHWFRAEASLVSGRPVALPLVASGMASIKSVIAHTMYVDSLDELISRYVSLRDLWWFREDVKKIYEKSISDGPDQPIHALSYLKLLSRFPECAYQFDPSERSRIGEECVRYAEEFLSTVASRIHSVIEVIAAKHIVFDNQIAESNAIYKILEKKEDFKPDKHYQPPESPGNESTFKSRMGIEELRLYQRNVWQLCSALNEFNSIIIYDTVITPREWLSGVISSLVKGFLERVILTPPERQPNPKEPELSMIQPPSVLIKQIYVYLSVVRSIENYVDLDVNKIINSQLLNEVYSNIPIGGKLDWIQEKTETHSSFITHITNWYTTLVTKKFQELDIVYSPLRKGFVGKLRSTLLRTELWCDLAELKKLCSLVGIYGAKLIDKEMLKYIAANLTSMRDLLKTMKPTLEEMSRTYHDEAKFVPLLRQLRGPDVDTLMLRSISIGNALHFRKLLFEALGDVTEEEIPIIKTLINSTFEQYSRNTFMAYDFVPMDSLAHDVGIDVQIADQELKTVLIPFAQADSKIWNLLAIFYAASFAISSKWKEAVYRPVVEAEENNSHVLAKTISDLILCFNALITESEDESEIKQVLLTFVEMSSVILLRMFRPKEKGIPKDLSSVVIFMDLFIQQCPLLSREEMETMLPYAFLRSMWRDLYSRRIPQKEKTDLPETEEVF